MTKLLPSQINSDEEYRHDVPLIPQQFSSSYVNQMQVLPDGEVRDLGFKDTASYRPCQQPSATRLLEILQDVITLIDDEDFGQCDEQEDREVAASFQCCQRQ